METGSPASTGTPLPGALGEAGALGSLLRRIKGKLFTCWTQYLYFTYLFLCGCSTAEPQLQPLLCTFITFIYFIFLAWQKGKNTAYERLLKLFIFLSLKLLDCFGIPVLMALSWFVLRARYRVIHFIAVFVCLLGVGTMVGADILAGRDDNSGSDVLIGDLLVLLGASLYAVSNVCEEYIVKKLSRQEFLGMVGLFGTIISALLFVAFALCMFCLYSFMPLVIKVTSATSVNLGILTADLYSLFFGLFLFGYKFSGLYILSFTVIMVGFILYCSTPTRTAEPAESNVPPVTSIGIDNLGLKLEESGLPETQSAFL
uniref:Solute carrier family 35 member F2 n=1 Tax=Ictidomys tridecemlineatus TaxID=43179 RepID=I3MH34_ICTTR